MTIETGDLLATLGAASLVAWLYLTFGHGRFWRADQRLAAALPTRPDNRWPSVVAVVPARNEADMVVECLGSLLDQDYPGSLEIFLVDDHSEDGTGAVARALAEGHPQGGRLTLVESADLPPGWAGKMWAVHNGIEAVRQSSAEAPYLLLTDADVAHQPDTLRRLVSKAEGEGLDLVSLMVRLHCRSFWERLLIPAFVYFFQKLYPFPRVNDPGSRTAGAAGGCMLVRSEALKRAGGIEAIRGAVIDDCALGGLLKPSGAIWLGLALRERSVRPYDGLADIWNMVVRSAYHQLHYSPLLLAATVVGLALVYLVPPLLVLTTPLHGSGLSAVLGAVTWLLMARTYRPTQRLYRRPLVTALSLPLAGLLYLGMTLDSARRHYWSGGVPWKGRTADPRQ